jgi:hypothetical protein
MLPHRFTLDRRALPGRPLPSQTWRTFLSNHVQQLIAADFFVVPTATCRLLFVLVLLAHDRRRVVHVAVTEHPTAAWTVQQFRNAFPWDELPPYLLRDRDHSFEPVKTIGIQEVLTAPGSPWPRAEDPDVGGPQQGRVVFHPGLRASWANPIEAHFGPLRTFVIGGSNHPNHVAL